jgi:hypothetical protein
MVRCDPAIQAGEIIAALIAGERQPSAVAQAPTLDDYENFEWTPDFGRTVDRYYGAPTYWYLALGVRRRRRSPLCLPRGVTLEAAALAGIPLDCRGDAESHRGRSRRRTPVSDAGKIEPSLAY